MGQARDGSRTGFQPDGTEKRRFEGRQAEYGSYLPSPLAQTDLKFARVSNTDIKPGENQ
jgi:hypothetical protein